MTGGEILGLVAVAVMVGAAMLLAAAETAITRVSSARAEALVEEERRGAKMLRNLINRREQVLNPVLFVVLGCQLASATIVAVLVDRHWGSGVLVAVFIAELFLLYAVAEALPKSWALARPDRSATMVAPLVRLLSLVAPLRWVTNGIANLFRWEPEAEPDAGDVVEEELLAFAVEAAASEAIDEEEKVLIEHIIEFGDTLANEVMVPRPDIVAIGLDETVSAATLVVLEHGYSRVPAYGDGIDDIVGIVHSKDLMRAASDGATGTPVRDIMRSPVFVPESKKISPLLREMQAQTFHMAILIDEYGGTAGLVTLEDLIEELVGEIVDEFDVEPPMIEQLPDDHYRVNGRAALDDLAAILDVDLPDGEWSTVGGLIFSALGHVPKVGESVAVDGHEFLVERIQGRRIARVRVSPLPIEPDVDEDE